MFEYGKSEVPTVHPEFRGHPGWRPGSGTSTSRSSAMPNRAAASTPNSGMPATATQRPLALGPASSAMSSVVEPSTCTTVPSRSVPPGSTDSSAGCVGTAFESSRVACIPRMRACSSSTRAGPGAGASRGAVMVMLQFRTYVRIRQVRRADRPPRVPGSSACRDGRHGCDGCRRHPHLAVRGHAASARQPIVSQDASPGITPFSGRHAQNRCRPAPNLLRNAHTCAHGRETKEGRIMVIRPSAQRVREGGLEPPRPLGH